MVLMFLIFPCAFFHVYLPIGRLRQNCTTLILKIFYYQACKFAVACELNIRFSNYVKGLGVFVRKNLGFFRKRNFSKSLKAEKLAVGFCLIDIDLKKIKFGKNC